MGKTRVILVEDDPITALAVQKMLENLDYDVIEIFASGEDALDRLDTLQPDIILMDITLKGDITGIEAAAIINRNYRTPVIYLTANTNYDTIQQAKETTKSYGYLLKPVKGIDLHWTINTALKRHQLEESR
jgi:two-component system, response regulator PdtaR